jgi:transposase
MRLPMGGRGISAVKLGEIMMILDLHRQGLSVSAIAKATGADRKTVRKYIERGLEAPTYGPRKPRQAVIDPFTAYLRERVTRYPALTGSRLFRELKDRGYGGGHTAVTDFMRDIRPAAGDQGFEVRFETPPGEQAQVNFAQFQVVFTDEPTITRIVSMFSMVLGFSRLIWARFVVHKDLPTARRCHVAAFESLGDARREVLYDQMKPAVIGEAETGGII